MHQYDFEQAGHHHSVWSSSTEPPQSERRLLAVPESSTTPARKIAMPVSPVSMKTLAELAAQPNARASLLQLQRQHGNQFVQRFLRVARSAEGDGPVTPKVERAIESRCGGGQSLDSGIQTQMGHAMNADFSGVRVHTGQGADGLNRSLGAKAFTTGRDIYFREGAYDPGTSSGRVRKRHKRPLSEAGPRDGFHTSEARKLLAHELTHVVQQTSGAASSIPGSSALQRKVILKGAEMPAKDRRAFLKGHKWSSASRAAAIMEDMAAAGDSFDFADENELKTEIDKRSSTVGHMEESQQTVEKIPGDKRAAFGYPFTAASALYGPRVNYAAREYWEQATPDNYAVRKDKAKNKELMSKPRHQRCTVYGDQCDPYIWKLSDKGKKDPYHAIAYLFTPQPPYKRALLHCDYLISLVNFMSLADSIGPDEFNKRIAAFGADKIVLKTNLLMDLNISTFERDPKGEFTKTAKKGLGSMQRVSPSSEADLVIGDHVIFYNHVAYDIINANVGNAWRLENAVLVSKYKNKDVFLGHGSGYKTADQMHEKLAEEFNKVAGMALALVAKTKSADKKAQAAAQAELASKFSVKPVGKEWHIQGTPGLLTFFSCPRVIDEKLRAIKPAEVVGLRYPCDPSKMFPVERPIESAK
jgi:Domain of unknown function (DUF4157)/Protein-glutamine gamma-glutamyltransferase